MGYVPFQLVSRISAINSITRRFRQYQPKKLGVGRVGLQFLDPLVFWGGSKFLRSPCHRKKIPDCFGFFPPQTSSFTETEKLREFRTTKTYLKHPKKHILKGGMTGCYRAKTHPDLGSVGFWWGFCLFFQHGMKGNRGECVRSVAILFPSIVGVFGYWEKETQVVPF